MRKVSFLQMYQSTVTISEKMNLKCTAVTHIINSVEVFKCKASPNIPSSYLNLSEKQIGMAL